MKNLDNNRSDQPDIFSLIYSIYDAHLFLQKCKHEVYGVLFNLQEDHK